MTGLPRGWASVAVRDVIEDYDTIDPQRMPDQRFAYVDIGAIDNSVQEITDPKEFLGKDAPSRARRVIRTGDVLFSTVRTYLKNVAQVPPELDGQLTSTGICVLRANAATDPNYLFRWACSTDFINEISQAQDGTMYPAVRDEDVLAGPIPLPPLPEQRRIVRKLDTLSARSTTARTHLTAIEKLVERYKLAVLDEAYFSAMPESVELVSFVDALTETQNGLSKRSGGDGAPHKVLRLADLSGNRFEGQDPRSIVLDGNEAAKYLLTKGDLVIVRVNGSEKIVGRLIVWGDEDGWAYCDHFIRARARPDVEPMYLHFFFETDRVRAKIEATFVSSAGQKTVSKKTLAQILVPLPPREEQREIIRRIETAFAKIDRLAAEAAKALKLLGHLDQRILAKAFAGDLVPQDPNDEPAETLLARIRETKAAAPKSRRGRK